MKQKDFEFQIAFSFAQEDLKIAKAIAAELKRLNITYYLYTEELTIGRDITKETFQVYYEKSLFGLMMISENYIRKNWAIKEREIMQAVDRNVDHPYIIPLRLDDTQVEGLSPTVKYWNWDNNPSYIAISIYQLIYDILNDKQNDSSSNLVNNDTYNTRTLNKFEGNVNDITFNQ